MSNESGPKVSRRMFVRSSVMGAAALASLPAAAAFLEACSTTPTTTQAPASVQTPPSANPSAATQAPTVAPATAAAEVSDFGVAYPADAAGKKFQFIQEA